jgi:hypothetical protein
MFGRRFFGGRFFGARYWGDGGSGATVHATSGVLTGVGAAIVGSAAHIAKHATTGVLAGAGALLIGSAHHLAIHLSSGVLTGAGSVVTGSASRIGAGGTLHETSGVLSGAGAYLQGSAGRGTLYAIGQQARVVLEAKWAVDTRQITFDFISQMVTGEVLLSATNSLAVYSGVDLVNSLSFSGPVSITRTQVVQLITGGVVGCTYKLNCRGLTTLGRQTFLNAFLVVL